MSLTEKRIANLILLSLIKELGPEESLELAEGYLDCSPANRRMFEELTDISQLKSSLQEYLRWMDESVPDIHGE